MVDYAREAVLDLYDAFYELDDIMDYDFDAAVEGDQNQGGGSQGMAPQSSVRAAGGKPSEDQNKSQPAPSNGSNPPKSDNSTDTPNKTENGNAQLKSTTGFVEKLKKMLEWLKTAIQKGLESIKEILSKASQDEINKFLQQANDARNKNGLNAIPITNYKYSPEKFKNGVDGVNAEIGSLKNEIERIASMYEKSKSNDTTVEDMKRETENLEAKIWSQIAEKLGAPNPNGADPKVLITNFQNSFRGEEKKPFTIDEAYVNNCMSYLENHGNTFRIVIHGANETKTFVKEIISRAEAMQKDPSTSSEVQQVISSFIGTLNKFANFTTAFWKTAAQLILECEVNCKIVVQRAYNFSFGGAMNKADNAGENVKKVANDAKLKLTQGKDAKFWSDANDFMNKSQALVNAQLAQNQK